MTLRQPKCCPACNRPLPPQIQVGGSRRQAVVDFIMRHPDGVTHEQIIDHVYRDDENGGPEGRHGLAVMVGFINEKLRNTGNEFRIRGSGGRGSTYRTVHKSERGLHLSPIQRRQVARDPRPINEIVLTFRISRQTVYRLRKIYGKGRV